MARYEDYVKKDEIDSEIEDASEQSQQRQEESTIPERFRGKPVEEVARSYTELEKLYSKQAQDLGAMRRTVDELVNLKLPSDIKAGEPVTKPVTVDEVYEDADKAIRRVVKEESADRIAALEKELQQERIERAMGEFTKTYPTWKQDAASPEMINWIHEKPYRVRLARAADAGDLDAAADLFGSYYDTRAPVVKQEKRDEKRRRVLSAGLESAGAGVPETVETYSRSALLDKRIAAKRGDSSAERWLASHGASIQQAYAEGRIVD